MFRLLVFTGILFLAGAMQARSELSHKVGKGETLFALSRKYGVSLKQIQEANPGLNPQSIKVGQVVRIPQSGPTASLPPPQGSPPSLPNPVPPAPAPVTPPSRPAAADAPTGAYRVQPGDSLGKISQKFNVSTRQLKEWNDLPSDRIVVGRILRVVPPDVGPRKPVVADPPKPVEVAKPEPIKTPAPPEPVRPPPPPAPPPVKAPEYLFVSKVKSQIDAPYVRPNRWKYIVVHHSGTRNGNLKIFDYYHRKKGMENGVAYHFVIGNGVDSGDGQIEVTNRWKKQLQGGHVHSDALNEIALGICLVGDFNRTRPTRKQIAALVELIEYLSGKTGKRPKFYVHKEINPRPTDCPGKYFPAAAMHRLFDGRN